MDSVLVERVNGIERKFFPLQDNNHSMKIILTVQEEIGKYLNIVNQFGFDSVVFDWSR